MKNVQFVSELLMIVLENNIIGFSQDHIDSIYAKYDDLEELQEAGEFFLEEFTTRLTYIKHFLIEADNHNQCISNYASGSNTNFYTLWAFIHLNGPDNPQAFADSYNIFMSNVSEVKKLQLEGNVIEENVLKLNL